MTRARVSTPACRSRRQRAAYPAMMAAATPGAAIDDDELIGARREQPYCALALLHAWRAAIGVLTGVSTGVLGRLVVRHGLVRRQGSVVLITLLRGRLRSEMATV